MKSGALIQLFVRGLTRLVTATPVLTLVVIAFLTSAMYFSAVKFEENMTRDIEVYLPEGEESSGLLLEVRDEWSTDTLLVLVESRNAIDPERYGKSEPDEDPGDNPHNITYFKTLKEMSELEVAIDGWGQSVEQVERPLDDITCLEAEKGPDKGKCDGIVFTLSLSSIIKELNSTTPRFYEAVENKAGGDTFRQFLETDDDQINNTGTYDIPDDQDRINELVNRLGKTANNYAIDTNDDGIWDTASILFALKHVGEDNDEAQKQHIADVEGWIASKPGHPDTPAMAVTGLVVVLHDATARIYEDLLFMLPLAMSIVIVMMLLYHRNPWILPVIALPVGFALIWTLGIIQMSGVVLTPMIVAAGPILVGIGVDYGLHVANRINEFQTKEGLPFTQAVERGLATTGKATLLCAITDIIGFTALMISPIAPMRTVGITMIVGVTSAFLLSIFMVPPLMKLTKYKKGEIKAWKKVGSVPVRYAWFILVVIIGTTLVSLYFVDVMRQNMTGKESAPEDVESIKRLAQYSEQFDSGQTGVIILRADENRLSRDSFRPTAKDVDVLDSLNASQTEIDDIWLNNRNDGSRIDVSTVSVVNFFKAAHVEIIVTEPLANTEIFTLSGSFWEIIHHPFFDNEDLNAFESNQTYSREQLRNDLIDVFYSSFSGNLRAMLVTESYQKTLMYINMPYINIDDTEIIIDETDTIVDCYNGQVSTHSCSEELIIQQAEISHLTGGPPVTVAINEGIQSTQYKTILLSLALVGITMMVIFKSVRFGLATLMPILIVVAWQPLTMTAGSTHVNIFTAMIGTIIIGIGIDNAVQITERVREEGVTKEGITRAVEHTGQSLVEATSTTAGGVAAGVMIGLFRTQFVGLQNFFLLIIVLIFYSLVGGLLVLPAIYTAGTDVKRRFGHLLPKTTRRAGVIDSQGRVTAPAKPTRHPEPTRPVRKEAEPLVAEQDDEAW